MAEWDGGVMISTGSVSTNTTHLTWNNNKCIYKRVSLGKRRGKREGKKEDDDDNKYASRTSGSGAEVPFGPSVVTLSCDISRGPSGGGGGQVKGRWEYFQPSSVPYYLLPRVLGGRSDAYVECPLLDLPASPIPTSMTL